MSYINVLFDDDNNMSVQGEHVYENTTIKYTVDIHEDDDIYQDLYRIYNDMSLLLHTSLSFKLKDRSIYIFICYSRDTKKTAFYIPIFYDAHYHRSIYKIIPVNGNISYKIVYLNNGCIHRVDGPAIINLNDTYEYFLKVKNMNTMISFVLAYMVPINMIKN